jgi:hypothetical protein
MVPTFYSHLGHHDGFEYIMNVCFGNVKVYNTFVNMIDELTSQKVSLVGFR